MIEAYKKMFKNYSNFKGCSSVSDYWWCVLANVIIGFMIGFVAGFTGINELQYLIYLYELIILIPGIALAVRRMHDVNKSGWYLLMDLIPLVGWILVLIAEVSARKEPNNYGERV